VNPRPVLTLVAIVSADGFISTGKGVPWNLPRDKEHFRRVTSGQWVLVGRRTYEEMIGWFGDRRPLVLTRDHYFRPPVGQAVASIEEALDLAAKGGARELFVLGGGGPFAAAMPVADRLILTHVDAVLGNGVPFPAVLPDLWQVVSHQEYPPDHENPLGMAFATYERRQPARQTSFDIQKNQCEQNRFWRI
jgi:dihydrofolate reductase